MKSKTLLFRKWLSTGRLDTHLAKRLNGILPLMQFSYWLWYSLSILFQKVKIEKPTLAVCNRPFSKMAAENSNKLKLVKIKNVYQH